VEQVRRFLLKDQKVHNYWVMADYPAEWVRLVTKYEKDPALIAGALAFRASFEHRTKPSSVGHSDSGAQTLARGVDVVGESFCPGSFAVLRRRWGITESSERLTEVDLCNETQNRHSPDGKAVAVRAERLKLGYLPATLARGVFGLLEQSGGTLRVPARIWFDSENASRQKNSVTILGPEQGATEID